MAEKPKGKTVKLVYIGKRLFKEASAAPCFLERGKRVWFTKAKYCRIGHVYEMVDDKMSVMPESKGLSPKATEDQIEKWELEEQADLQRATERRSASKADKLVLEKKMWNKTLQEIHESLQRTKLNHFDREEVAKRIMKLIVWGNNK